MRAGPEAAMSGREQTAAPASEAADRSKSLRFIGERSIIKNASGLGDPNELPVIDQIPDKVLVNLPPCVAQVRIGRRTLPDSTG